MDPYQKYACFVEPDGISLIERYLHEKGKRIAKARRMVCELLHPKREAGVAGPEVWSRTCKRQGSWYRNSDRAGKVLYVGNEPVPGFDGLMIVPSDFAPPERPPGPEAIKRLVASPEYQGQKPAEWDDITPWDTAQFQQFRQGLHRMGKATEEELREDFSDMFPIHCANHANFLSPEFFTGSPGRRIPCSIATTMKICSACLELFGIIGADLTEKLVVLCPGAVVTTGLPRDMFFSVKRMESWTA